MDLRRLVAEVRQALELAGLDRLPDGRTSYVFDQRVVRFLRQAGVVSSLQGRGPGAAWGRLHFEQILTCRALQMAGASLAEVAESLRGRGEEALRVLRGEVMKSLRTSSISEPPQRCPSWRIGEDFILVSQLGRNLPPAVLSQIRQLVSLSP